MQYFAASASPYVKQSMILRRKIPPTGEGGTLANGYSVFFLLRALILNQIGLPMNPKFSRI
jgi:hypothetical protein